MDISAGSGSGKRARVDVYAGQESLIVELVASRALVGERLQLMNVSVSRNAILKVDLPEKLLAINQVLS